MSIVIGGASRRMLTPTVADRYRAGNLKAARIILAAPKYQGLMREIAERTLANAQADAENRRNDAILADEGDGQLDLFGSAAEGGSGCPQR